MVWRQTTGNKDLQGRRLVSPQSRTAPGGSDLHYDACPAGHIQLHKCCAQLAGPATQGDPSKASGDTGTGIWASPKAGLTARAVSLQLGSAVFELYIVASCQARGCGLQKPVWPLGLLWGHWAFVPGELREAGFIYAPRG